MIPINDLQSVIYKALNDNLGIAIYDEVLESDTLKLRSTTDLIGVELCGSIK